MGKSVSHGPVCLSGVSASERAESAWRMNRMIVGQDSAEEPFSRKSDGNVLLGLAGGYPCRLSDRCQNSQCSLLLRPPGNRHEGKDPIQAEDRWKAGSLTSRQCTPPYGQNNNGNPAEILMEPSDTSAIQSRFGPKWFLPVQKAQIRLARHAVCRRRRRHPDCSGVDTPPTTSLFWKGHQDASRTLEKMCWLWRGVRWRLTCASKCLAIMVLKKKNQSRSYLNHLVFCLL